MYPIQLFALIRTMASN